jgi:hypothetical protein
MNNRLAWSALLSAVTAAGLLLRDDVNSVARWTYFCVPAGNTGLSSAPAFLLGLLVGVPMAFPLCVLWLRWARPLEDCDAR